jgi:hypothetical protein
MIRLRIGEGNAVGGGAAQLYVMRSKIGANLHHITPSSTNALSARSSSDRLVASQ